MNSSSAKSRSTSSALLAAWPAILLMAAYMLPSSYAVVWPDAVRDISASLSLVRGESIPLSGPPVNYGPHVGPAWVWLQSIVLLGSQSLAAVSAWVALLASLKFVLLYELGRRASGPRLAICFALAAAFPSVAVFQWSIFFHPNTVEAGITASLLLMLMADQRKSIGWLLAAAAMLGLAMQLHLTAAFYLPLLPWLLYRIGARGGRMMSALVAMALAIAIWFAPLLFTGDRGTMAGQADRVGVGLHHFNIGNLATVLRNAYVEIPMATGETYGAATGIPLFAWNTGLVLVGVAVAAGALLRVRERGPLRRPFLLLASALGIAWIGAVAVRDFTSFYLAYFLLPLSSIVAGMALHASLEGRRVIVRAASWAALAFLGASFIAAAMGAVFVGKSGLIESRLPPLGALSAEGPGVVRGGFASATARDGFMRRVCSMHEPAVTAHGEIAYALAASANLDQHLHCPSRSLQLLIAGNDSGPHITAIPAATAARIGVADCDDDEGLCLISRVTPVLPAAGRPIERDWYYFEQLRDRGPMQKVSLRLVAQPGGHVMIFRLKPFEARWNLLGVSLGGVAMKPEAATYNSEIYGAPATMPPDSLWSVEFETDAPQWVDVHQFRDRK